jgi:hypothetical protein
MITATVLTFWRPAARLARHSRKRKLIGSSRSHQTFVRNIQFSIRYYFFPLRAALAQVKRSQHLGGINVITIVWTTTLLRFWNLSIIDTKPTSRKVRPG